MFHAAQTRVSPRSGAAHRVVLHGRPRTFLRREERNLSSPGGAAAPAVGRRQAMGGGQTVKDVPQPQLFFAFGLLNLKPLPLRLST
jgi:hypothetical protein